MKLFWLLALLCLLPISVSASVTDIYVAQSSAGGNTGADCADARALSSLAAGDEIGGNKIHFCSTITSGFSILGSGSAGNVLTFVWEPGARVSVTAGQIINLGNQGYLLFDGGVNCGPNTACYNNESASPTGYPSGITGIIEATANGSGLAHQNTSTQAFYGNGFHDVEIRNLIIRNLYQHTSTSDQTPNADSGNFLTQCSSGQTACTGTISIHDSDIHDMGNAISFEHFSSATLKVYNNECWHNNWCLENSGNGTRTLFFNNNHCHDASNWDTVGGGSPDLYHHNCIHNYMNTSSDSLGYYVYNNRSDGNWGTCCTTSNFLFTEVAPPANFYVFNNIAIQQCVNTNPPTSFRTVNAGAGPSFYNNTFLGCSSTSSNVEALDLLGTGLNAENNAIENYGQYVLTGSSATFSSLDYNSYGAIGLSGNSPWQCGSHGDATFAAWQTSCSGDAHGQKLSSLGVSATGVPSAISGLVGAGVNLTSLCTGNLVPLCADANGSLRTAVGAWTSGALNVPPVNTAPSPHHTVIEGRLEKLWPFSSKTVALTFGQ